jgi:hypothetical protein
MGEPVKQLQLVDSERFNRLISALQQTIERNNIVDQATASPKEQDYVNSYHDVMKSVQNKSPLAGADIVNFLNKKDKLKESLAAQAHVPQAPAETQASAAENVPPELVHLLKVRKAK